MRKPRTPSWCFGAVVIGLTAAASAQSLPTGHVTDCADVVVGGNTLTVTQLTPDCVIDWSTFSIADGFLVEFLQADTWRVLNRVGAGEPSEIAGVLRADGTMYLVNPDGIVFREGAVVNVGGIYAAAAAISDADFLAGTDRFTEPSAKVLNEGTIQGRLVHLLGERIANLGTIETDGGIVTMLAGEDEIFLTEADGRIHVRIDGTDLVSDLSVSMGALPPVTSGVAGVENSGTIDAAGSQVVLGVGDVYALAIRNAGQISVAGGSLHLAALGGTVVHGQSGGSITAGELAMTGEVLVLDGDVQADTARFNDPVILGSDVRVAGASGSSADTVHFASTIDSQAGEQRRLEVVAGETIFDDDVGVMLPLERVDVDGDVEAGGDVITVEGIDVSGDLALSGAGEQLLDGGSGDLMLGGSVTKATLGELELRSDGRVDVAGDTLVSGGGLTMAGAEVWLGGDTIVIGDVQLEGEVTLDGAGAQTIRSVSGGVSASDSVRKVGGGDLLVQATTTLEIGGDVAVDVDGGSGQLRLTAPGGVHVGGDVDADGDISVTGPSEIGGSVTTGSDALFVNDTTIGGDVVTGDDARFFGSADVGGDVTAFGDAAFAGAATVGGSVTSGEDATFGGVAEIGGGVSAAEDVEFAASAVVGGDVTASDDVLFEGTAVVGGSVSAVGDAEFLDDATITGAVSAGEDVEFTGISAVGGDIDAGDDVIFFAGGTVGGDVVAGDDVESFAAIAIGGSVTATGDAEFVGSAEIVGTVLAGDDVIFFADSDVGGDVVAVDDATFFGDAVVGGDVVSGDDAEFHARGTVGGSISAVDDVQFTGVAVVSGDIAAGDDVEFGDRARLGGDVVAWDNVVFDKAVTLTADGDQSIEATVGSVRTRRAMTKDTDGSLTLIAGENLSLNGGSVLARGDVLLNPAGRSSVPEVASISAEHGLTITSREGDVIMGRREKLTTQGSLTIDAAGRAEIGDLNTLGDMRVFASEILLLAREGGTVLLDGGATTTDDGVDYVAGGRFSFRVTPEVSGEGGAQFASSSVDSDALGTLDDFRPLVLPSLSRDALSTDGMILDLVADGAAVSSGLAEAFSGGSGTLDAGVVSERAALDAAAQVTLADLGIDPRPLSAGERADWMLGQTVFFDLPQDPTRTIERPVVVARPRLDGAAVTLVEEAIDALLGEAESDAAAEIRATLAAAWDAYAAEAAKPDGAGFRVYLETTTDHAFALDVLNALRDLSDRILVAGTSRAEMTPLRRTLLRPLRPEAMKRKQLEQAIDGVAAPPSKR